jgi:hypothetical protein
MALDYFKLEKGIKITGAGSDAGVLMITGSGAPTQDADVGSQYLDQADGRLYTKILSGSGAEKWSAHAFTSEVSALIGVWRKEKVVVATADSLSAGVIQPTVTPFSDQDDAILISEYAVGKLILSSVGSAIAAWEITNVTGDDVTIAAASVSEDDTFLVEHYLPDSTGQESISIVVVKAGVGQKVADIDWKDGNGILVGGPFASADTDAGDYIAPETTLKEALQYLESNVKAAQTLSGVGSDLVYFSGQVLPAQTANDKFQNIERFIHPLQRVEMPLAQGEIVVDYSIGEAGWFSKDCTKWIVQVVNETANGMIAAEVMAINYSIGGVPRVDYTVYGKVSAGGAFDCDISVVDVSVYGLKLKVNCGPTDFVRVAARRINVYQADFDV